MKTVNVLACAILMLIILMLAGTSHAIIDPETILAMWLFDEVGGDTTVDNSGNGHDATLIGNVTWPQGQGKFDGALQFDGIDAYLKAGPVPLPSNSFTATLWAYIEEQASWAHLLENGSPEFDWWGSFRIQAGAEVGWFYVALGNGAAPIADNGPNGEMIGWEADKWSHIAVTYDGAKCRLYLNGSEATNFDCNLDVTTSAGTVLMGCFNEKKNYYKGLLDDVAIFSVALGADQINNIMNNGLLIETSPVEPMGKLATTWSHVKGQ